MQSAESEDSTEQSKLNSLLFGFTATASTRQSLVKNLKLSSSKPLTLKMPEGFTSLPQIRCGALEEFFLSQKPVLESSKSLCNGRRTASSRINGNQPKARKPPADVQPSLASDDNGRSTKTRYKSLPTQHHSLNSHTHVATSVGSHKSCSYFFFPET